MRPDHRTLEGGGLDDQGEELNGRRVDNAGKMERRRLRACTGMRYALLNPILEQLAREGRIIIVGEQAGI